MQTSGEIRPARPIESRPDPSGQAHGQMLDDQPLALHCETMSDTKTTLDPTVQVTLARFRSRPADRGWLVLDTWTGEPANIGGLAQVGLSKIDADHTAAMLQSRATNGGA